MFFDDHVKATTIIRGKRDARGGRLQELTPMKPEVVKDSDGNLDGKHLAMQDFLAAHHEGSAQKMSEALSNFLTIHNAQHEDTESASG